MRKFIYLLGLATLFAAVPVWAGMGAWTSVASPAVNGKNVDVKKLARHPTNAAIRYAATGAGMYKSTDGGLSWQAGNTGIVPTPAGYLDVNDTVIDPANPGNIYIAPYFLQKSVDGGNSWSRTGWVTENPQALKLAIDPKTPTTVYAGSNRGVYKSTDGASTWKFMGTKDAVTYALAIDPINPAILYWAVSSGIYKSTDGGASWNQINSSLNVEAIAMDPQNSANIYVGTAGSGVYKSSDGGITWNAANQLCYSSGSCDSIHLNGSFVYALIFDSSDSSILYLGNGDGIYKSVDGGAHWTQANNGPMPGASTLMLDPNDPATVIAGNLYGIYSYTFPSTSNASQTIGTVGFSPSTLTVGGTATVSATATSGLAVIFSSTTPGVCTVSGSTVTGVAAGTCTIAANQSGNASYAAATQVTQNINVGAAVTPPTCTLTAAPASISAGSVSTLTAGCSPAATSYIWSANTGFASTVTTGTVSPSVTTTYTVAGKNSGGTGNTASATVTVTATSSAQVIEFYNTNLNNYFITADANEAAQIDGGSAGPGWSRTGNIFASGGSTPVCRFYGSQSPGPNSHFYTVDAAECQGLKDQQIPKGDPRKLTDKSWNFESLDFISTPPTNGVCPSGTAPVYRAYNNGFTRGVDSNHRITSNLTAIQQQVACGWTYEGVVMCAPSGTSSGGTTSCGSSGPGVGTSFTLMTNPTDGHILSAKSSGGTTVRYYGKRDPDGIPTSIENIQVAAADGKTTRITLDSAKRPARMRSPDGVVFDLTYSGNQAGVTAVSADGLTRVSTIFPIGTASTAPASSQVPVYSNLGSTNGIGTDRSPAVMTAAPKAGSSQNADWVISVNQCGGVGIDNAFVAYTIGDSNGYPLAQGGAASNISGGEYVASIPTNLKPPLDNNQILDAASRLEWYLDKMCGALGLTNHPEILLGAMCPYIGGILVPVIGPGGPAIGSACAVVSAAAITYCSTLGIGPIGPDSLAKRIINGLMDPGLLPDTIQLQATADTPGLGDYPSLTSSYSSIPIYAKASGPFPPATISVPPLVGKCHAVVTTLESPGVNFNPSSATVNLGETASFTVTATPNYRIASVAGCGGTLTGNTYTTGYITGPCTVFAFTEIALNLPSTIITSISPTKGSAGTAVTITGSGFGTSTDTRSVTFNGLAASNVTWSSDTLAVAKVPQNASSGNVMVTVNGVKSNGVNFDVLAPTITSISPAKGPVGTAVTITGSGFGTSTDTRSVTFNGLTASNVTWNSDTSAVATVPQNASSGNVMVTVNGVKSNGMNFDILAQCSSTQNAGGDTPDTRTIELGKPAGTFDFTYETYTQKDQILVKYQGNTLFDTGCVGANGTKTLTYSGSSTQIVVQVIPNCAGGSGTLWNYTVACPK